jgi:hypothetical protein
MILQGDNEMKSTIVNKESNVGERTYPYIGKHVVVGKTVYVLFSAQNTGTVLNASDNLYDIGYFSADWKESVYEVLDSGLQIILQND